MNDLIAVGGKMGSGKDTVANMLQYLLNDKYNLDSTYEDYLHYRHHCLYSEKPKYKIRKFAYPLKKIVCIILGCTMDDLESRSFKDSFISEEWEDVNFYTEYVKDLSGKTYKLKNLSFSQALSIKSFATVREVLQYLGTNLFKDQFHNKTWINILFREHTKKSNWIISDLRFEDEVEEVLKRNGIIFYIERKGLNNNSTHKSERVSHIKSKCHFHIKNDEDLRSLFYKLREICSK